MAPIAFDLFEKETLPKHIDFMAQSHFFWLEQKLTKHDFFLSENSCRMRTNGVFQQKHHYIEILKLKHLRVQDEKC